MLSIEDKDKVARFIGWPIGLMISLVISLFVYQKVSWWVTALMFCITMLLTTILTTGTAWYIIDKYQEVKQKTKELKKNAPH